MSTSTGSRGGEVAPDGRDLDARASAVITRGGVPSDAELAALTVALTALPRARSCDRGAQPPAWARAALLEASGIRLVAEPAQLDGPA